MLEKLLASMKGSSSGSCSRPPRKSASMRGSRLNEGQLRREQPLSPSVRTGTDRFLQAQSRVTPVRAVGRRRAGPAHGARRRASMKGSSSGNCSPGRYSIRLELRSGRSAAAESDRTSAAAGFEQLTEHGSAFRCAVAAEPVHREAYDCGDAPAHQPLAGCLTAGRVVVRSAPDAVQR